MTTFYTKVSLFFAFLKRVLALSLPYFKYSPEKRKAQFTLAAIVALNLAAVYMLVLINEWNRVFYDALQNKDEAVFWSELGRFLLLAFGFVIIAVYRFWLTQLLEMRWRGWMTQYYVKQWMQNQAFYRLELLKGQSLTPSDNPDQRIQEDVMGFTQQTVSLSMGLLNAVVTLVSFVGILWSLSGAWVWAINSEHTLVISGFMVWMAVIYALIGSLISHFIGRPLIDLHFSQQKAEADYRHLLVRVREYSDAIALERGQSVETLRLDQRFVLVLRNYLQLIRAQKRLTWFTVGFNQLAVVFPFVIAAPRFFSGAIQLGQLMQIASAFSRVQDGLSWFVDNYAALASWRATTDRLTRFDDALKEVKALPMPPAPAPIETHLSDLVVCAKDLQLKLPNQSLISQALSFEMKYQQRWAITGPSGSGKSTLIRTLAGVWPWYQGHLQQKKEFESMALFIAQRPYFPQGSLRDILLYPDSENKKEALLHFALEQVELSHLVAQLDEVASWNQVLSGGELQRLALARAFIRKPLILCLDESSNALNAEMENRLYQRLLSLMEKGLVISVSHRPEITALHEHQLILQKG